MGNSYGTFFFLIHPSIILSIIIPLIFLISELIFLIFGGGGTPGEVSPKAQKNGPLSYLFNQVTTGIYSHLPLKTLGVSFTPRTTSLML